MFWLFVILLLVAVGGALLVHEVFWLFLIVALVVAYGAAEKTVVR